MIEKVYNEYIAILKEELIPALGCTEPIAVALASSRARKELGEMPDHVVVSCSGNIIKNAKSVIVPATGDLCGIEIAAVLGMVAGDADAELEVFKDVKPEDITRTQELVAQHYCEVKLLESDTPLHIVVHAEKGGNSVEVELKYMHTLVIRVEKNGEVLFSTDMKYDDDPYTDRTLLNLNDIYEFANTVELSEVDELISRQIEYNNAVAKHGLEVDYGVCAGKTILKYDGDSTKVKAKAMAAAAVDARMGGCILPVIINSGSGNQGMTIAVPTTVYAEALGASHEKLVRALVFANLVSLLQKRNIGRLSAYCGAVSAAVSAGAAVSYLHDAPLETIEKTITNGLATISGMVCDGAKASCASKVAAAVDTAITAHQMAMDGLVCQPGDGLVKDCAEKTIASVGRMARNGMQVTDHEILEIMIETAE